MRMSLSSIFSFNTLSLKGLFTRDRMVMLATTFLLLLAAEGVARRALSPTGEYWEYWNKEAADHFLWYRRQALKRAPAIVITGDSTAARDFDPQEFENVLGATAFNLGWPANFPLALEKTAIPLFDAPYHPPETLIVSISAKAFTDHPLNSKFETPILSCAFSRHQDGETLVADYVYLARINASQKLIGSWFTGKNLFFSPADNGAMLLDGHDRKPTDVDQESGWKLTDRRLDVITKLTKICSLRGTQLFLVVPPRNFEDRVDLEEEYLIQVCGILEPGGFAVLDCRRVDLLADRHFYDSGHLNREGAKVFSRYVAELISQIRAKNPTSCK